MSSSAPPLPAAARALVEGVFDYAGMFPPASLSVAAAVRHYHDYLEGPHAWMLGRLVVPSANLLEVSEVARPLFNKGPGAVPWRITVVAGPDLEETIRFIERFNTTHSRRSMAGYAVVDMAEHRVARPGDVRQIDELIPVAVRSVFEIVPSADLEGVLRFVKQVDGVAKLRTGGLTADAIPAPDTVARFIVTCARLGVPMKATAGLHHAFRGTHSLGDSDGPSATMHGFLNVLVAGAIARARLRAGAKKEDVQIVVTHVLQETRSGILGFADGGLAWHEFTIENDAIASARHDLVLALGSCSFEGPISELRDFGLPL